MSERQVENYGPLSEENFGRVRDWFDGSEGYERHLELGRDDEKYEILLNYMRRDSNPKKISNVSLAVIGYEVWIFGTDEEIDRTKGEIEEGTSVDLRINRPRKSLTDAIEGLIKDLQIPKP